MESFRLCAVVVVVALCLPSSKATQGQNLTAVKCNGTLPTGRLYTAVVHDNNDSIYIFGGYNGNNGLDDAVKYSISQDTTEVVGQLPYADYGGSAFMNKFGNIFYLSGFSGGKEIFQYFPEFRSFVSVSSLEEENYFVATTNTDIDTALLFGGFQAPRSIVSLNLNTLESNQIAQLSEDAERPAAIWVEEQDSAYIFNQRTVQKYSRSGNTTEKLSLQLPMDGNKYGAVWDGRFGYLIGKVRSGNISQSLVQFNPVTETVAFIPVEDFISVEYATAVYIQKLNRIYWFGGIAHGRYYEGIHYIDLIN